MCIPKICMDSKTHNNRICPNFTLKFFGMFLKIMLGTITPILSSVSLLYSTHNNVPAKLNSQAENLGWKDETHCAHQS